MSEISSRTFNQLQLLADKLKDHPDYMAWVFASYQKIERYSDLQLMEILGTSPVVFIRIALCKRPLADTPDFAKQVKQIADYSSTDPSLLANIIRQVDSLQALYSMPGKPAETGPELSPTQLKAGLLAARDRLEGEHISEEESSYTTDTEETRGGDGLAD